jgi:pimeloyl-ACP methyl ester carboxylesterase
MTRAPRWFTGAVASKPADRTVEVEGCPIHYLHWGEPDRPGLVLVHGGAAHAHWWSFIGPQLTRQYSVAAVDLSGHGDSGRRPEYSRELWSRELMAVAADAGMTCPILVGHSMGGHVSIVAAALYGEQLAGAVIVDSPVRRQDPESEEGERGRAFRNPKTYPDADTAVEHFHLIPPQPCENDFVVEHIARHSVRQVEGGWTWKFDPAIFGRGGRTSNEYLPNVACRVAVLHGQYSAIVTDDVTDYMSELLGRNAPFVEIPASYHHLILDQPLAFIAALRALLADWEHSVPRR